MRRIFLIPSEEISSVLMRDQTVPFSVAAPLRAPRQAAGNHRNLRAYPVVGGGVPVLSPQSSLSPPEAGCAGSGALLPQSEATAPCAIVSLEFHPYLSELSTTIWELSLDAFL
jgi:hypothetical protein